MFKLRDYQESGVDAVRAALRLVTAVLFVLCTSAGKTVIFSYIARAMSERGFHVLILAHRDFLIKQASNKLDDYGVPHGIIKAGMTPAWHENVQVASVQTIVKRLKFLLERGYDPDLIIIDEAHLSCAKSYHLIRAAFPRAKLLGVTGTPCRLDGKGLGKQAGGLYDTLIEGVLQRFLIDEGFVLQPEVYGSPHEPEGLNEVKLSKGDLDMEEQAVVMNKPTITGSAIEQYLAICPGVPAAAWCCNIKHAIDVAADFNAAGVPSVMLDGDSSSDARDAAMAGLTDGSIKVVTFCNLLVEGVDCPAIGALILLRRSMSLSGYRQTVGRGLRTIYADGLPLETTEQRFAAIDAGSKGRICYVIDHVGLWRIHGFPDDPVEWSLDGIKKRKGKKKDPDDPGAGRQCPKCYHAHKKVEDHIITQNDIVERQLAANALGQHCCPKCFTVYESGTPLPEVIEGKLEKITPEMRKLDQAKRKLAVKKAETLEALIDIGKEAGYSDNWAENVWRVKKHTISKRQRAAAPTLDLPPLEAYAPDVERIRKPASRELA